MIIDVNVLLGNWPFRRLPHTDAAEIRKILKESGITKAVVGSVDAVLFRNVQDGNEILYKAICKYRDFFIPAATVNPSYAGWQKDYKRAIKEKVAAIRLHPEYQGWNLLDSSSFELFQACSRDSLPVILTAEIEDVRQRHPLDKPVDWTAWQIRQILEKIEGLRILIVNARAERIREVSLTLDEKRRKRVFFDTSGLWGPLADEISLCIGQVGISQFVFGTHAALKTPEASLIKLRLSEIPEKEKRKIFEENVRALMPKLKVK